MCCCESGCEGGCCGASCKYKGSCIHRLGWTLVVLGVIGFILGIVADVLYVPYVFAQVHRASAPLWGGLFIIITGGLAVCGGKNPDDACKRIALLVMSIFGIIFAMTIWIMGAVGVGADGIQCDDFIKGPCDSQHLNDYSSDRPCSYWSNYWFDLAPNWRSIDCSGVKALHALQLLLGLAETVLMFIVCIRCCAGTCCKTTSQQPTTHAIIYQPGQPVPMQFYSGVVIMQSGAPGAPPVQSYVGQPANIPYIAQPGLYPAQTGQHPAQAGVYPTQQAPHGGNQPGTLPQPQPPPTPSDPPPYELHVTDTKQ